MLKIVVSFAILTASWSALACEPIIDFTLRSTVCAGGPRVLARADVIHDSSGAILEYEIVEVLENSIAGVEAPTTVPGEPAFGTIEDDDREALLWLRDVDEVELRIQESHSVVDGVAFIHDEEIELERLRQAITVPVEDCHDQLRAEGFRDVNLDSGVCFGCSGAGGAGSAPLLLLGLLGLRRRGPRAPGRGSSRDGRYQATS
jgi:hypothetical protein